MNTKTIKILYFVGTGLLTALMLFSASMYFLNYEMVAETFTNLGFPSFIIYPLATAKILGLIALWSNFSDTIKQWAYAGFFFNVLLAAGAHLNAGDGEAGGAIAALVFLGISFLAGRKLS